MDAQQRTDAFVSMTDKLINLVNQAGGDKLEQRELFATSGGLTELTLAELVILQQQVAAEIASKALGQ